MMGNRRDRSIVFILSVFLLISVGLGLFCGAASVTGEDILFLFRGEINRAGRILLYVRIPRVAGAVIAGMGLAASGAVIQVILNNPLAGPNIIGVNSGAGFAVVFCSAVFPASYMLLPFASFAGAFFTVLLVYYIGKKTGLCFKANVCLHRQAKRPFFRI